MRRGRMTIVAVALAAATLAAAPPQGAIAANLSIACASPATSTDRSEANCSSWHTASVKVFWGWDTGAAQPSSGDCYPNQPSETLTEDTVGTPVTCTVQDLNNPGIETNKKALIRIDQTAPSVTAANPDRPADHNGWWNHPVAVAFQGSDATSGIASCDVVSYSGPDGANAQVTGSCRDRAGNVGTSSFPLRYDATAPAVTGVVATRSAAAATLGWQTSPDAVSSQVARSPGLFGAATSLVYGGPASSFSDSGLSRDVTYTYNVTAVDDAGNQGSATTTAPPPAASASDLSPVAGARLKSPPLLKWKPVANARYYNVQLFRRGRKILSGWPKRTQFQLKRGWRYRGHRHRLSRGVYSWYVWPGFGARSAHRYGNAIGQGTFRMVR